MGDLSKNFNKSEFKCKCGQCEQVGPAQELVEVLQEIRDHFGTAITINSGHRCPAYNYRVGGARRSQHMLGTAADFNVKGKTPNEVQDFILTKYEGMYGIGRYNNFTHIDVRGYQARWDNRG